ncbi:MAG TPA: phosphate ABC transporter permease PstA [Vicinamibacterales bacterium]|nr:phosphate ABC transporter permease PstA [Vicinamibacterales bacterium]
MTFRELLRRGDPAIWFAGTGLGICLLMIAGMLGLILVNGLGFFWPRPLVQATLTDGSVLLGEQVAHEAIPRPGTPDHLRDFRTQFKVGNRDLGGADFRWVEDAEIVSRSTPADATYVERREYGPLIGRPVRLLEGEREIATGVDATWEALQPLVARAEVDRERIRDIERDEIGAINARLERERLALRKLEISGRADPASRDEIAARVAELQAEYASAETRLVETLSSASATRVVFAAADGAEKELQTLDVYRIYRANELSLTGRIGVYAGRLWEFLSGDPRESNTEGGILPAIFGTVMMVILMSILAVPFGVLAALYLREYARQGVLVRFVRIAVNNLAGVPSIVFGVFGLGFFVYFVGGAIDQAFFAERLPTPTFGTGGILWASLTLGLLTVPVVIVASEEALGAVPRSMREASLATGATKFQTILRVVLPAAAPGVLTGLILAMARGAGEVAPLMITGVVKLAPDLPLDGVAPFVHLDRKFMHLGYHIYDVGFQSPNVEAAKPMVYATAILLLVIVVALNLTAIIVRNHLRRRYQTSAF